MPNVNGKEFPYTEEGMIAAEQAASQAAQQAPQEQAPQEQAPQEQAPQEQGRARPVDPEVLAEFEDWIDKLKAISYQKPVADALMKSISDNADSVEGVGKAAAMLVVRLDEKSGDSIPEEMIIPLAEHALFIIVELVAITAKIKMSPENMATAGQITVGSLLETYGVSEETLQKRLGQIPEGEMGKVVAAGVESMFNQGQKTRMSKGKERQRKVFEGRSKQNAGV